MHNALAVEEGDSTCHVHGDPLASASLHGLLERKLIVGLPVQ